ncbi:drug/metabolite transporter (DMT)-like permease [Wenyingzhuangia heitensis]|uniref:Drug/metabolite transporter (DMT)-like permease n=1 Tax=Wenyingzhuangia heitensis TaxID=1487859 RepID=A0ABX0U7Y3_9FLAO|nr:EamA/RhaT family transporter [Wenyingzhuangia heitensis]NIJ44954.1 drug/metabolite transporter (DMT)-like permease [Wenyingzhuangia heitensis]
MVYLLLSIFFTTAAFLTLKEFNRFKIDNLVGIVVSYFTALLIGSFFSGSFTFTTFYVDKPWVWGAVGISTIFIIVFNLMALTAQKGGLSVMSVANKMSVVIPISFGVLLYNEALGPLKILGIVAALLGVWFTSKKEGVDKFDKRFWYLPFFIFIGSGLADSLINHMQTFLVPQDEIAIFSTSLFWFCGVIGVALCLIKYALGKLRITFKSIVGGLVLGVPNYFSIYYILKALSYGTIQTALVFSLNNLLVVLLSVFLGVVLYKEKLSKQNYIGIAMSAFAIVLLYFAI